MAKQGLNTVRVGRTHWDNPCLYPVISLHLELGCAADSGYDNKTGTMEVNKEVEVG